MQLCRTKFQKSWILLVINCSGFRASMEFLLSFIKSMGKLKLREGHTIVWEHVSFLRAVITWTALAWWRWGGARCRHCLCVCARVRARACLFTPTPVHTVTLPPTHVHLLARNTCACRTHAHARKDHNEARPRVQHSCVPEATVTAKLCTRTNNLLRDHHIDISKSTCVADCFDFFCTLLKRFEPTFSELCSQLPMTRPSYRYNQKYMSHDPLIYSLDSGAALEPNCQLPPPPLSSQPSSPFPSSLPSYLNSLAILVDLDWAL